MNKNSLFESTGIKMKVIQEILQLAKTNSVKKVVLFGSRARGDYKERSDIDLAFQGGNSSRFILDVDEETSTLLEFDIIDLDKPVREELLDSIKREGIVLYECNGTGDNGTQASPALQGQIPETVRGEI